MLLPSAILSCETLLVKRGRFFYEKCFSVEDRFSSRIDEKLQLQIHYNGSCKIFFLHIADCDQEPETMDVENLYRQYRGLLLDDVVPFSFRNGIAWEHGGVLSCIRDNGSLIDRMRVAQAGSMAVESLHGPGE